jgi:hypothetical protein
MVGMSEILVNKCFPVVFGQSVVVAQLCFQVSKLPFQAVVCVRDI